MTLGERLLELRKNKHLSQEELAEKLDVTRQTISKWETDQSTPDFDKIIPICNLYEITSDELLTGNKNINGVENNSTIDNQLIKKKRAKGISIGILLYFISIIEIMITISVLNIDPIIASAIFLFICAVATITIVYTCIFYKEKKTKEEEKIVKIRKQIESTLAIITAIIYLLLSFITMAWHITWIIWIIYGLICEIIKLIFMLRGNTNEK
jgi:transcriptional regulator with XRE-family HTH domain